MMSLPFQTKILQIRRLFGNKRSGSEILQLANTFYSQKRQINLFLNWFIAVFNRVDRKRLKLLGPDCTCAEWLLRNGAAVRFKGHPTLLSDYNELIKLEETQAAQLKIQEIYAEKAGLSPIGFNHLKGCNHIEKITFIFCTHLFDSALQKLIYVKDSLQYLEVKSCFNIEDKGLMSLQDLKNLKVLILGDLVSVKNEEECEIFLRRALPQCKIEYKKIRTK